MLLKKRIWLSLLVAATLFAPIVVGHGFTVSQPTLRADGGAPPPPPPWPKALDTALYIS
jgi:hypothetical protein